MTQDVTGDYQSDEAHNAMAHAVGAAPPATQGDDQTEKAPTHLAVPPVEPDGDFSYDMAHDGGRPPA